MVAGTVRRHYPLALAFSHIQQRKYEGAEPARPTGEVHGVYSSEHSAKHSPFLSPYFDIKVDGSCTARNLAGKAFPIEKY